jgi:putative cardiolipin synthase
VGDEYFGATDDVLFADLDVLVIGPVVNEVSRDFDRYWASESSYPVSLLVPHAERTRLAELAAAAASARQGPAAAAYLRAIRDTALIGKLAEDDLELDWAATRMVSDDPAKGLGRAAHEDLLPQRLKEILGEPASELQLVSPYFVPAAAGEEWFAAIARRGVSVRVLTNSFEATDVALVHAGYAKRREELLESGIALYEMKLRTPAQALRDRGLSGSSGSSLHAKTFAVDGARMFVGSFNFDPRSADLNTEMGFVIESPVMARRMTAALDDSLAEVAYEVRLSETGQVLWIERGAGEVIQRDSEPGMSAWQRIAVSALSMLPIEWLL